MLPILKQIFSVGFLFVCLFSCQENYGNKLESNNLDVYYIRTKDEGLARKIGNYWKENDFLFSKKQTLQLDYQNETFELKMIASDTAEARRLSFDERAVLVEFQKELNHHLQPESKIEIILCDNQFNRIYNINQ